MSLRVVRGRISIELLAACSFILVSAIGGACSGGTFSDAPTTATSASTSTAVPTTAERVKLDRYELLELARDSVVRVRNTGCGELSTGSAWLAPDGRLVSNRHVVEGLRFLEASTWDGRDLSIESAEVADDADISRIAGDWSAAEPWVPLRSRDSRVEPGERIAILGYPEGNELQVTTGIAVGYQFDPELAPREILKLTTVVKPGNSGGPAVDMFGRVVGVVYAKELATSESLVVPVSDVLGGEAVPLEPAPPCDR